MNWMIEIIATIISVIAYILFFPILIGIFITLITLFVKTFSPNKDARDQAKIYESKIWYNINRFVEFWYINVVEKLYGTFFGIVFVLFALFIIVSYIFLGS